MSYSTDPELDQDRHQQELDNIAAQERENAKHYAELFMEAVKRGPESTHHHDRYAPVYGGPATLQTLETTISDMMGTKAGFKAVRALLLCAEKGNVEAIEAIKDLSKEYGERNAMVKARK